MLFRAYFAGQQETLEAAQEPKLDLICRTLVLSEGERLLDTGCAITTRRAPHGLSLKRVRLLTRSPAPLALDQVFRTGERSDDGRLCAPTPDVCNATATPGGVQSGDSLTRFFAEFATDNTNLTSAGSS
jgi:hypothetical protein